jgi:hypothetical protein
MLNKTALLVCLAAAACSAPPPKLYTNGGAPAPSTTVVPMTTPDADSGAVGPLCDPKTTWSTSAPMAGLDADDALFGSITPDALAVAWMTKDGKIHWADRATTQDPFGTAGQVSGDFAVDRVALSADGLRIMATSQNRRAFGQISRATRSAGFASELDTYPFAGLNASVKERNETGQLGDLVMSPDERTMVFSYWWTDVTATVRISHRASKTAEWGLGVPVAQTGLTSVKGARRRPTATSSDNRSVFFWDEINGTELIAQREGENATVFTEIVDIGMRPLAVPNATCTVLVHAEGMDVKSGAKGIVSTNRM